MATAGHDYSVWTVRCGTCGEVLAEGQGEPPKEPTMAIREAVQTHQQQQTPRICQGQPVITSLGRITED